MHPSVKCTRQLVLRDRAQVAFYRQNPRYMSKEGKKELPDTVPVLNAVQTFLNDYLSKMHKGPSIDFSHVLKGDSKAQSILEEYSEKLRGWHNTVTESATKAGQDVYTQFVADLDMRGCIQSVSVEMTNVTGTYVSHTVALTKAQAQMAFLNAQKAEDFVFSKMSNELAPLTQALAQCGDNKYSHLDEMTFDMRVRGFLMNVMGEATEQEVASEADAQTLANSGSGGAVAEALEAAQKEAVKKSWRQCWRKMAVNDLYGYPLWETQLHDILKEAYPELQKIFTYYCGASIQGSESIGSATKIGVMEFLMWAKDVEVCTKEFKSDALTRQFYISNSQAAIADSGSAERHKAPGAKAKNASPGEKKKKEGGTKASAKGKKKGAKKSDKEDGDKEVKIDAQLSLYEFVNAIVRIGFWRANPQWGSKYNKRELTPVPESVEILMKEILTKAKRDTSVEFKKVLAGDEPTQKVLMQYRDKLQNWVRPILHRVRRPDNPNPKMTYKMWVALMDGPDPEHRQIIGTKAPCPKMVGEWYLSQESQITGDERVLKKHVIRLKTLLSIPQCRWNFLRSQTIDQMDADEDTSDTGDYATLDFSEMLECIARCAVDKYRLVMTTWLPSHNRMAMTMADAVRSFIRNLLSEASEEVCMYEASLIKADRYDWKRYTKSLPGHERTHKLFLDCWERMPLMDIHYFPLWEKGVHDVLQQNFPVMMRIFSHYTKGISGIDSAADALEMELEEFHDFVKDARLETKLVNFTTLSNVFAKANATNTAEAFEQRQRERRNAAVQHAKEEKDTAAAMKAMKLSSKPGAFPDVLPDRFASEYPEPGSLKRVKPDNRLVLFEFVACLVRISFVRANPKHGQYDNKAKLVPLPGCLERMLVDVVIPNAKQDMSSLFREEIEKDAKVQAVFSEYEEKLRVYYQEATLATSEKGKMDSKLTLEAWSDICKGYLTFKKKKDGKHWQMVRTKFVPGEAGLGEASLVGEFEVYRESEITGDERCKEKYSCRLTVLQIKYAFLNSQSLDQMKAGDASNDDAMATLDFDEFKECVARCGRDKYDEVKQMTLADGVRGFIQNILGEKGAEAVIRDITFIRADRYDWKLSKAMPGQLPAAHRKWLEVWQNIEIADLHHFPLWEQGVHDVLQSVFSDLISIFTHYCRSVGGSTTAEDAVEMTLSEFKDLVKDVNLETKDLRFDVMCNMFIKANALNTNEVREQRINSRKTAASKNEGESEKAGKKAPKKQKSATALKDQEQDQELVLYEFVALLVRISFWRANPFHGMHKLATKLVPLPDCLFSMLHEVVLPNAKRDDSALFKDKLANDKGMLTVLETYNEQLQAWFEVQTQSMFLREDVRKLQYQQWQDILKKQKVVGTWEVHQESEVTGDERCKTLFRCSLSLPQAKFAFLNSQSLDQMSAGVATDSSDMTTLDFEEFKECIARCGVDKYKPVKVMTEAASARGFILNLLGQMNEEEVMIKETLIKADRFNWKRGSRPLPAQSLKDHKKWLECWSRIELMDMYHFPLWEEQVHDVLQKHFVELGSIFLGYTRSISEVSAEDALEMSMTEFKDFVEDCGLITKEVDFNLMTNQFIKANAVNTAAVAAQHAEGRRNAEGKKGLDDGGKKDLFKKEAQAKVKGANDGGEAKKDQELVLYEFVAMLVRISFQRANPTFGNFGDKRKIVMLPGCLERMIEDEILPRARRDTASQFRETVLAEVSVQAVLTDYRDKLRDWYTAVCADDRFEDAAAVVSANNDKLGFKQWLAMCKDGSPENASKETPSRNALVGVWSCHRESDITGDPRVRTEYSWRLSIPQVKAAFMDSQNREDMGAAQVSGADDMAVLDFDEFVECVARVGADKYRAVKEMSPAGAIRSMIKNMLGEAEEEEVVVAETYIHAERYDASAESKPLENEGEVELQRWLECWSRIELMDMHFWPTWEKEVHDILQPLFKELQTIFLAYTRSISEDSAEDAMEMSMDEFHDFVVDVGLETKKYKFDVMCNQFIKANATNIAQVREQHHEGRRNATGKVHDTKKEEPKKVKGTDDGGEAKKDQELVLYEFISMLVRISFWRCNPTFGNFGDKAELATVPAALSLVLNEVVLPNSKRDTSAQFRDTYMKDSGILRCLNDEYTQQLLGWYTSVTQDDSNSRVISDKLTFEDWLRVVVAQDLVGVWEVEQMSEITGDTSTKGNVKCRLSLITCKAAFMDSQSGEMGVAQQAATSDMSVLDFEEFKECVARCGVAKYSAVKQISPGGAVKAFIQNMIGERTEEQVLREDTYIRAERFDAEANAKPLAGQTNEKHALWIADWKQLKLDGLYGFPTWEKDVHDLCQKNYEELLLIFKAYCKGLGQSGEDAMTMDLDEFHDFAVDVGLENLDASKPYAFESMKEQFTKANQSGKGLAGPAANSELVFYEFLQCLIRVSFARWNPTFGELVTDSTTNDLYPVPIALAKTFAELVLPSAQRDEPPTVFREKVLSTPPVKAVIKEYRERVLAWYTKIPFDETVSQAKLGIKQWVDLLYKLLLVGDFSCLQGSDIVGDDRIGTEFRCRLSVPQAKAAFANSQQEATGNSNPEALLCDFEEMLECIARCGVDKYRTIKAMDHAAAVRGMIQNVLGDADETQVITNVTYIHAERFDASGGDYSWLQVWSQLQLAELPGFPLWEKEVHDLLQKHITELSSIFRGYAAGSLKGAATEMDKEEFHDFVVETDLATKEYGFNAMTNQFTKANQGSDDNVLELHEFVTMLVRISFFRANPHWGLTDGKAVKASGKSAGKAKDQKALYKMDASHLAYFQTGSAEVEAPKDPLEDYDAAKEYDNPLPGCLQQCLEERVLPDARRDDAAKFKERVFSKPDVQTVLNNRRAQLLEWWEMASGGKDKLELDQWIGELEKKFFFSDLTIGEHKCRFSEPQARAAFYHSASEPAVGLAPEELLECVTRCGVAKYRGVKPMGAGAAVDGFCSNLLGEGDEEQVVLAAVGSS